MNPNDVVFIGLKKKVAAFTKRDGRVVWQTELSGGMGDSFVTITCDDLNVFAYTSGHLYCLDIVSGKILWRNDLPGFGYGMGALCLYGFPPAPDPAILERLRAAKEASRSSSAST